MRSISTLTALGILVLAGTGCADGPGGMGLRGQGPRMGPENTPGWHMMNQAERDQHHKRTLAVRTPEECRQIMDEHRRRMQERARARGMTMPPHDSCAGMQP